MGCQRHPTRYSDIMATQGGFTALSSKWRNEYYVNASEITDNAASTWWCDRGLRKMGLHVAMLYCAVFTFGVSTTVTPVIETVLMNSMMEPTSMACSSCRPGATILVTPPARTWA